MGKHPRRALHSLNRHKEFPIEGQLVTTCDRKDKPAADKKGHETPARKRVLHPPEILTIEEVARTPVDGIDLPSVLSAMADIGPEARLFVYRPEGKLLTSS